MCWCNIDVLIDWMVYCQHCAMSCKIFYSTLAIKLLNYDYFQLNRHDNFQAEGRATEDAVPLQRPHLRGQDWGPEALFHQGDHYHHHHHHHRHKHSHHHQHHEDHFQKEELDRMMMNLSGDSKANIDKILEEFRNAKMVQIWFSCFMITIIILTMISTMAMINDHHEIIRKVRNWIWSALSHWTSSSWKIRSWIWLRDH